VYFPSGLDFLYERFASWLAPFEYTANSGQFIENLWVLKDSGMTGHGLGLTSNVHTLAEIEDDFILTLILGDTGVVGMLALLASFALIIVPALLFATEWGYGQFSDNQYHNYLFYKLLVLWLTLMFGIQILIVVGMVTGLLPVMGLPLPFVGRGGSSLILFSYASVGFILMATAEVAKAKMIARFARQQRSKNEAKER